MVNWGAQILGGTSAPASDNLSCWCVAPNGSGCDPGDMSSVDPDHKTLFLRNYELYEAAKERGESKEIQRLALLALNQIYLISDVPAHADREANAQVMHDLLGPSHSEAEVREKYDQLRDDAGV